METKRRRGKPAKRSRPKKPVAELARKRRTPAIQNHIREFRLRKNLTQAELAEYLGVSIPTLSTWENHRIAPEDRHKMLLCKALKCNITDLFDWEV